MREKIRNIIRDSVTSKALLLYDEDLLRKVGQSAQLILKTIKRGGKVLIFGNGGSAADSQHFAAELVGRFQKERRALPAIALTTDTSLLTALANDYSFDIVFKRQLESLATSKDVVFAISTSGRSKNVIEAVKFAKKLKIRTIGLTGKGPGALARLADIALVAPSGITARIQEIHILIIHIICEILEDEKLR